MSRLILPLVHYIQTFIDFRPRTIETTVTRGLGKASIGPELRRMVACPTAALSSMHARMACFSRNTGVSVPRAGK